MRTLQFKKSKTFPKSEESSTVAQTLRDAVDRNKKRVTQKNFFFAFFDAVIHGGWALVVGSLGIDPAAVFPNEIN